MSRAALDSAWREARDPYAREHVTPFIWKQPDRFRLANVADADNRAHWCLTLDTADDLARLRVIWSRLGDRAGLADVAALVAREPGLEKRTA
jgi:spore coat polysaccharide biosynthesis protein SpsF